MASGRIEAPSRDCLGGSGGCEEVKGTRCHLQES